MGRSFHPARRKLIIVQPVIDDCFRHCRQLTAIASFHQERVCSQRVSFAHVAFFARGTEDYHWDTTKLVILPKPFQKFKTWHPGHAQIEQYDMRQRKLSAVCELSNAGEIVHRYLTVLRQMNGCGGSRILQCPRHEENIIRTVLNQQNCHIHQIGCSFIQNLLPCPRRDSTPTSPPMRSTVFFTMESPIPVPSYSRS